MARGILGASVFRGPRARQQGLPLSRSYQMGGAVDPLLDENQSVMDVGAGAQVGTGAQVGSQDVSSGAGFGTSVVEDPYASISGRIRSEAGRRDVPDNFLDVYANAGYRKRQGLERFLMSREYRPDAFAQPGRVPFEEAQATIADPITVVQEPSVADGAPSQEPAGGTGAGIPANIRVEAGRRDVPDNFLETYGNAGYVDRGRLERFLMSREYKPDAFPQPGRGPFVPLEDAQDEALPGEQVAQQQEDSDAGTTDTGTTDTTQTDTTTTTSGEPLASPDEIAQAEQDAADAETADVILVGSTDTADRRLEDQDTIQSDQETFDDAAAETADIILDESRDIADDATVSEETADIVRAGEVVEDTIQQEAREAESLEPDFVPETLADSAAWLRGTPGFRTFNQPNFDLRAFLEAGANAPRRDIDIPETLYPWQEYTDAERDAGYTIPVFQPMATGEFQARGGAPIGAGTPRTSEEGETTENMVMSGQQVTTGNTQQGEEQETTAGGHTDADGIYYPPKLVESDTTAEDWTCADGSTPYITYDGTWMCQATDATYVPTPASPKRSAAHGGPINAGIGNLMSRQRQYDYPDGTQMVEKVSQGRIPFGRR